MHTNDLEASFAAVCLWDVHEFPGAEEAKFGDVGHWHISVPNFSCGDFPKGPPRRVRRCGGGCLFHNIVLTRRRAVYLNVTYQYESCIVEHP
jgi:hypothetical protein